MTPEERAARCINDNLEFFKAIHTAPGTDMMAQSLKLAAVLRDLIRDTERAKVEECARLADNPYGDEVEALGTDEPKTVGMKIAKAIRALFKESSEYRLS